MIDKDIIVFDLDGTLANTAECRHHLEGKDKDWDAFYLAATKVSPIDAVIKAARAFRAQGYEITISSGRSDAVLSETQEWLRLHKVPYSQLIMRPAGDHKPDNELKHSWVVSGCIPIDRVLCVFEDRSRMVKMWRELGVPCFQVGEGDF